MPDSLPDVGLLGVGFDILGDYSATSRKERVVLLSSECSTEQHAGKSYSVPQGVAVVEGTGAPSLVAEPSTFESDREIQKHFAAKAHVKGTYGSFSGEVEALYGFDQSAKESSWYALVESALHVMNLAIVDPKPSSAF